MSLSVMSAFLLNTSRGWNSITLQGSLFQCLTICEEIPPNVRSKPPLVQLGVIVMMTLIREGGCFTALSESMQMCSFNLPPNVYFPTDLCQWVSSDISDILEALMSPNAVHDICSVKIVLRILKWGKGWDLSLENC